MADKPDRDEAAIAPTLAAIDETGELDTAPVPLQSQPGDVRGDRYTMRELLGQGGMGEVRLAKDRRVGREVAMKILRQGRRDAGGRFIREVRVQGRLEHPAIVPVYDLGVRADERPFFTMRRLRGRTLSEIISAQAKNDDVALERYPRTRLLATFASVCQAIEYAHQHGVIHRDIKPDNIMLGDYGEVYVLDWGIALQQVEPSAESDDGGDTTARVTARATLAGTVLGTPGYMSPEQVRGDVASLGPATDIYALGMVLFELLTRTEANTASTVDGLLAQTLDGVDCRISMRFPDLDVPPELEEICVRATARKPEQRYPSVRAMLDAIERYLDGDRDLQRRQELAAKHTRRAREALSDDASLEQRATAMREAGRALALDPESVEAAKLVTRLVLQPPREMPEPVREAIATSQHESTRALTRLATWAFALMLTCSTYLYFTDVISFPMLGLSSAGIALALVLSYLASRRPSASRLSLLTLLLTSGLIVSLMAYALSPFIIAPASAAFVCTAFLMHYHLRPWWIIPTVAGAGLFLPLILELLSILPPSIKIQDNTIRFIPRVFEYDDGVLLLILLLGSLTLIALSSIFVNQLRRHHLASDRRLLLQAWHLRQALADDSTTEPTSMREG